VVTVSVRAGGRRVPLAALPRLSTIVRPILFFCRTGYPARLQRTVNAPISNSRRNFHHVDENGARAASRGGRIYRS